MYEFDGKKCKLKFEKIQLEKEFYVRQTKIFIPSLASCDSSPSSPLVSSDVTPVPFVPDSLTTSATEEDDPFSPVVDTVVDDEFKG